MKEKWVYYCQECGQKHSKWQGKCQGCNAWNTLVEEKEIKLTQSILVSDSKPIPLNEIEPEKHKRLQCDLPELDSVLGGGLVPGAVVLLGGEPGVGKSTLLLQACAHYANQGLKVLYVSGEESSSQIALRAKRLGIQNDKIFILAETAWENIEAHLQEINPTVFIMDSVQTVYRSNIESPPGSITQLRECTFQIMNISKRKSLSTFLIGHVTKEGAIAGPKILEHMVDVVLYFESSTSQDFRLLRSIKNRFGSTNEVGVFQLQAEGLKCVANPSELFLSEKPKQLPGSVIVASIEGTRSILVEIQALASTSHLTMPRRTSLGLDSNRLSLLLAVLEKRGGYRLFDQDIFVNVAGGLRLTETAADLGIVAALISSYSNKAIDSSWGFFGEVGLGGEIRAVAKSLERLKEMKRIGLKHAFVPQRCVEESKKELPIEVTPVKHVQELIDKLFA